MNLTAYTPRSDSLASQVVGFFTHNPREELLIADITEKFSARRGNIPTLLGDAVTAGLLIRARDGDGDWVYTAGSKCPKLNSPGLDMDIVHQRRAVTPGAVSKTTKPAVPLPRPEDVVVETDVPLPTHKGKIKQDWTLLLKRLQPGNSCKLPLATRHLLAMAITAAHKAKQGTYSVRTYPDTQELRVWRVA